MGNHKSLLAVEIIEIILHKCQFLKCEERFSLGDELTEIICQHRIVTCPDIVCDEKVALSDLMFHSKWYAYRDTQLVLCLNKSGVYYHFYFVMFKSEDVCAGYDVKLELEVT